MNKFNFSGATINAQKIKVTDKNRLTNVFKFRAECKTDGNKVKAKLDFIKFEESQWDGYPDYNVVITTKMKFDEIQAVLRSIEDGQVMLQTIQPIESYTGERNYDLE